MMAVGCDLKVTYRSLSRCWRARRHTRARLGGLGRPATMTSDLEIRPLHLPARRLPRVSHHDRVPPLLHMPLMSATNAISGIFRSSDRCGGTCADSSPFSTILGTIAVGVSSTNVVAAPDHGPHAENVQAEGATRPNRARQRLAAGPILWGAVTVAVAVLVILAGAASWTRGRRAGARGCLASRSASSTSCPRSSSSWPQGLQLAALGAQGHVAAELGMPMAIVGTLFHHEIVSYRWTR